MPKNKYILFVVFGLLFIGLGLFREYFFIQVNNIMTWKYYGETSLPIPGSFSWYAGLSYEKMYYLKYVFTGISFLLFFALAFFCLRSFTENRNLLKWLSYSYLLLLTLCLISMAWGYFVKMRLQDDEYTFSRWLMGIAQSPLIVLFFIDSSRLNNKLN